MEKDLTLVYMLAGLSSRFEGKIKQLVKISNNGQTLIEKSIEQAIPYGFTKIVFIVGNKTEQPFKEKFGVSPNTITISGQSSPQREKEFERYLWHEWLKQTPLKGMNSD